MPGSRHRRPAGRHDPRLCRSGANKRCLFRAVHITFDDPGLDPLAPPQGGATPSLAPSSKVAKSRSVSRFRPISARPPADECKPLQLGLFRFVKRTFDRMERFGCPADGA